MRTKHKVAVSGLGAVTRNIHFPAYSRMKEKVEVVAGCDVDPCAEEFLKKSYPEAVFFTDFNQMLEQAPSDIISICTPPKYHVSQAMDALAAGFHVFLEKPLAHTLEEADTLINAALDVRREIVVNSEFPYMNIHRSARECIGTPGFGELLFVSASQNFTRSEGTEAGWRKDMDKRLGFEFTVHVIDIIRTFFDGDPVAITAVAPNPTPTESSEVINIITLEFSKGRAATIVLDRLNKGPEQYLNMQLDGERATIKTSIGGELRFEAGLHTRERVPFVGFHFAKGGKAVLFDGNRQRLIGRDGINPFAGATAYHLNQFLDAIDGKSTPAGTASDHRKTLALILAAYESVKLRKSIDLNPYFETRGVTE